MMTNISYLYNPDAVKDKFDRNYFVDKKLGFSVIERGTVLPHKKTAPPGQWSWGAGGIVDSRGEYIKGSHVTASVGESYTPPPHCIRYSSETVVYLGMFFHVWGHAILDNIRRMWFLKSDYFRKEFKSCPLIYIPWTDHPLEGQKNFRRLLEILEVDVDRLQPITQPTQFDKIILPDESTFIFGGNERDFTAEYRETIDRVRHFAIKNRTPTPFRKIYYYYGRKQIGEERIAKYFMSKGYTAVQPEFLTTDEQLNLLINAESFASTIGSCSHNSIFLRDNAETIFIPRYANAVLIQPSIDQVHPVKATYIDSSFSVFNVRHDLFCFMISGQLKRFFGDKFYGYTDEDFQTFLQYFKFAVDNGRDFNPKEVQGYGSALEDFLTQLKTREDLIASCFRKRD